MSDSKQIEALKAIMRFSGLIGGFVSRPEWWSDDVSWEEWVNVSEQVRAALGTRA